MAEKETSLDQPQEPKTLKELSTPSKKSVSKLFKLLNKLGIKPPSILNHKTPYCRHAHGCIENVISGFVGSFTLGYVIKACLNLLGVLFAFKKLKKNPLLLLYAIINKDNIKFAAFPGCYALVLKLSLCLLRLISKRDSGINDFLSGAIAGAVSINFQPVGNRTTWGVFLLARAFDATYQHYIKNGTIKKIPLDYVLLFAITNMLTGYSFANEPDLNPSGLNKFYLQMANMHKNDLLFRDAWITKKTNYLKSKGVI